MRQLGYLLIEGVRSIFTHGFMSFACILVIVACLLIMGNFALLAVNVDYNIDSLESQNEILAFVDDKLSEEQARSLQPRLSALENVSSVLFVTREQAMDEFISDYDDPDMFQEVTPSWFRNRYIVFLEDLSLMGQTQKELQAVNGIADVSASLELSQGFITVRNIVSIVSVILIAVLFVVSVFIMQNTIKLATFSRREEIGIMKMVGASNFFIRCPFIIEGLALGLAGGAVAFGLQWGIYDFVALHVTSGSLGKLVLVIPFESLRFVVLAVFLAIGLVVGTFGSNLAIRNYLKV